MHVRTFCLRRACRRSLRVGVIGSNSVRGHQRPWRAKNAFFFKPNRAANGTAVWWAAAVARTRRAAMAAVTFVLSARTLRCVCSSDARDWRRVESAAARTCALAFYRKYDETYGRDILRRHIVSAIS